MGQRTSLSDVGFCCFFFLLSPHKASEKEHIICQHERNDANIEKGVVGPGEMCLLVFVERSIAFYFLQSGIASIFGSRGCRTQLKVYNIQYGGDMITSVSRTEKAVPWVPFTSVIKSSGERLSGCLSGITRQQCVRRAQLTRESPNRRLMFSFLNFCSFAALHPRVVKRSEPFLRGTLQLRISG